MLNDQARLCLARHLQLPRRVGGDQLCDLTLERREEAVLCVDLRFDRLLRGCALCNDSRLRCASLREQRAVAFHCGSECLHLRQDVRVERGDALRAVHAIDHVVEVARTEDHLERRCLIRRVERDQPLRDRFLALAEVVLRDVQFVTVLTQIALDPCELCVCGVVLRTRPLERVGQLLQLPHDLLRLCSLRRDRRIRKRRNCRQEGQTDPCENVRRQPQPTNDNSRTGSGTGAPGGAGTSRGGRLAMCSDQRQR